MEASEGVELGLSGWKEFVRSPFWAAVIFELKEREKYILDILRVGNDETWSDENMRGRLSELEYVSQIPLTIMLAIQTANKAEDKIQDEKGE